LERDKDVLKTEIELEKTMEWGELNIYIADRLITEILFSLALVTKINCNL